MNAHLLQAIVYSLWAVLMLRMYGRAKRLHLSVAMKKKRAALKVAAQAAPMAVKVSPYPV